MKINIKFAKIGKFIKNCENQYNTCQNLENILKIVIPENQYNTFQNLENLWRVVNMWKSI